MDEEHALTDYLARRRRGVPADVASNLQLPAAPANCTVQGLEAQVMLTSNAKSLMEFTITARDQQNRQRQEGGEVFFVAVRGAAKVRARVTDNEDGTYTVQWRPTCSGLYTVTVSLFGLPLAGSPWQVRVADPSPYAPCCEVRGDALHRVVARSPSTFEIRYRDRSNRATQAVELDVFVVAQPDATEAGHGQPPTGADGASAEPGLPTAWDVATHPEGAALAAAAGDARRGLSSQIEPALVSATAGRKRPKGGGRPGAAGGPGQRRGTVFAGQPAFAPVAAAAEGEAASTSNAERAAGDDDGYASAEELLTLADRVTTRRRPFLIEVRRTTAGTLACGGWRPCAGWQRRLVIMAEAPLRWQGGDAADHCDGDGGGGGAADLR